MYMKKKLALDKNTIRRGAGRRIEETPSKRGLAGIVVRRGRGNSPKMEV